jgi:hypothetical protein
LPILREQRNVAKRQRELANAAEPQAVGVVIPQNQNSNPRHKEDFTSLLNAAAKTKLQGG